jgi:hypothetical protein
MACRADVTRVLRMAAPLRRAVEARPVPAGCPPFEWPRPCGFSPLAGGPGFCFSTLSISLSGPPELTPVLIHEAHISKPGARGGPVMRLVTDMLSPSCKLHLDVRELDGRRILRVRRKSATSDLLVGSCRRRGPGQVQLRIDNWGTRPFHVKHSAGPAPSVSRETLGARPAS